MESQLSILEQFAQDCLVFKSDLLVSKEELYDRYVKWCSENNQSPKQSLSFKREFLRMMDPYSEMNIHHVIPDLVRKGLFKRVHIYRGVGLR